ncbi:MAG TPA: sensor domain-containing diguanylate cyclase, partial [Catenuloplanes sp.]
MALFDDQRRFHHANPAAERLLGLGEAELVGHTVLELSTNDHGFLGVNRAVALAVDRAIGLGLRGGSVRDDETAVVLADGSAGVLSWTLDPIEGDGRVVGAALILRDMTALSQATFVTAPVGMVRVGPGGEVRAANRTFQAMLGLEAQSILDRPLRELLHPGDVVESARLFAELMDGSRDRYETEHRFRRSDGTVVWCRVTMTVPGCGDPDAASTRHDRAIGVVQDITERKRLAGAVGAHTVQLELLSRTDQLTGLSNRRHLEERLTELAGMMRRRHGELAVLMIDLDRFKDINDTHGHGVGDQVLRTVSQRLRGYSRADDVIGRWGGEEFLVVCPFTGLDGVQV